MKFRAEPKDILAFLLVSALLLYLVAIGVLNISSISKEGKIYGFVPFEAFSKDFLLTTIVFFIIALVALFTSVKSYFFEREKGDGILPKLLTTKKEDGYSRWAKETEIMKVSNKVLLKDKTIDAAGIPLFYKNDSVYVDSGEAHSLIIGATGSGKTQMVVHPLVRLLCKKGESMIITDPKGEIYENNGKMLRDYGYNIILLNFRDPQNGNCWNPFELPYRYDKNGKGDKANELLNDLALNILSEQNSADPFWTNSAADYFTGLALGMFEDAKETEVNINSINLMATLGDERYGSSTYLKEYFKDKDPASPAAVNALGTVNAPADTKDSITSVMKQKIKVFAVTQNLSEMLSRSDFNIDKIGEEKTAVFMIIQDEKTTYHPLATIFIKQCYEALIDVAQRHGGALPVRTNYILDEFANMPKLNDISTMITAARSRHIRFNMIIQNFAQLNQVYTKEVAETIRGNCGNIIYLLTGELQALEEISKLCGDKLVKVGKDNREETRPLVTVSELQRMQFKEAIVMKHRKPPFKTKLKGSWEIDFGFPKYEKDTYPERDKGKIAIFNIVDFVKAKKQGNLNEVTGRVPNNFGSSMNGSGLGSNFPSRQAAELGVSSPLPRDLSRPTTQGLFQANSASPFAEKRSINAVTGTGLNNSFNEMPKPMPAPKISYDLEEILKRVDEKIAKIESEEKQKKAKGASLVIPDIAKPEPFMVDRGENKPVEQAQIKTIRTIKETSEVKEGPVKAPELVSAIPQVVTETVEEITSEKDFITDDQFFDDFFFD